MSRLAIYTITEPLTQKALNDLNGTKYMVETESRLRMRINVPHLFETSDILKMTYSQMHDFMMGKVFTKHMVHTITSEGWGIQEYIPHIKRTPRGTMLWFTVIVEFTWTELV